MFRGSSILLFLLYNKFSSNATFLAHELQKQRRPTLAGRLFLAVIMGASTHINQIAPSGAPIAFLDPLVGFKKRPRSLHDRKVDHFPVHLDSAFSGC